jgi:hypothetical protein
MVDFKIHLVRNGVAAFSINFDLYFFRSQPYPQLFNDDLTPQTIHNFDNWFQAKTHQRYSYRGFMDMVGAFEEALKISYSLDDLKALAAQAALAGKKYVLTERMSDYRRFYWIEILDPIKFDSSYAELMRDKFEHFQQTLGTATFFNHLCRFHKIARKYSQTIAGVFERLIRRLGHIPQEPSYPLTDDLDADLVKAVLGQVVGQDVYKAVPRVIQDKIEALSHAPS